MSKDTKTTKYHFEGRRYREGDEVTFLIDKAEAHALTGGHSIRCRVKQIIAVKEAPCLTKQ